MDIWHKVGSEHHPEDLHLHGENEFEVGRQALASSGVGPLLQHTGPILQQQHPFGQQAQQVQQGEAAEAGRGSPWEQYGED